MTKITQIKSDWSFHNCLYIKKWTSTQMYLKMRLWLRKWQEIILLQLQIPTGIAFVKEFVPIEPRRDRYSVNENSQYLQWVSYTEEQCSPNFTSNFKLYLHSFMTTSKRCPSARREEKIIETKTLINITYLKGKCFCRCLIHMSYQFSLHGTSNFHC